MSGPLPPTDLSAALFRHPASADGIAYTARHDDTELCHAFFDRSDGAIEAVECQIDLDQDWFWVSPNVMASGLPRSPRER